MLLVRGKKNPDMQEQRFGEPIFFPPAHLFFCFFVYFKGIEKTIKKDGFGRNFQNCSRHKRPTENRALTGAVLCCCLRCKQQH